MTPSVPDQAATISVPQSRDLTLGWALRRALLGLVILFLAMGSLAWLTYASIDPALDRDEAPAQANQNLVQPISVRPPAH
jgi:type II secretory pathway component PulL